MHLKRGFALLINPLDSQMNIGIGGADGRIEASTARRATNYAQNSRQSFLCRQALGMVL